jgi:hypothetical protein
MAKQLQLTLQHHKQWIHHRTNSVQLGRIREVNLVTLEVIQQAGYFLENDSLAFNLSK